RQELGVAHLELERLAVVRRRQALAVALRRDLAGEHEDGDLAVVLEVIEDERGIVGGRQRRALGQHPRLERVVGGGAEADRDRVRRDRLRRRRRGRRPRGGGRRGAPAGRGVGLGRVGRVVGLRRRGLGVLALLGLGQRSRLERILLAAERATAL